MWARPTESFEVLITTQKYSKHESMLFRTVFRIHQATSYNMYPVGTSVKMMAPASLS